ncbi:hypothetical protein [Pseudomonas sp.]|uniref:hypothetical protein n=1 Tax=Pseudomonas sp. TaxID=306 RepID=UPI003D10626A
MNTQEKNTVVVMLVQALIGAISSNFRMVLVDLEQPVWVIDFILAIESDVDREEIEDVITRFDVYMMDVEIPRAGFRWNVSVIPSHQALPAVDGRCVFRRREDGSD